MVKAARWPHLAAYCAQLGTPVAIVDLESTGGDMWQDRITEVAVLRFDGTKVVWHEWLVNPEQPISSFITRLTGIDNQMVVNAPKFAELAPKLLPLLRGALVVAHNSRFDYTFLRHEFKRAGMDFSAAALCTVQLSRRLYPQYFKHNLDSIIERFRIKVENRHRAMTDVLALADFMEQSLAEKGVEEWGNHARALMNPPMLPTWLPHNLATSLQQLPDAYGVVVWLDAHQQALAIEAHERTYSEVAKMLHGKQSKTFIHANEVRFMPALGPLHALCLKAELSAEYHLRPSESRKPYFTVLFTQNEQQHLQARIVPLSNGYHDSPPHGLFLHKKAAKRALGDWAQTHQLCPASLNILPTTYASDEPCPMQAIGECDGHCHSDAGSAAQNRLITQQAYLLPVADWGRAHEIEVMEHDLLSGKQQTFHCRGGAVALANGKWYFDDNLPALLKAKFKQGEKVVKIIA